MSDGRKPRELEPLHEAQSHFPLGDLRWSGGLGWMPKSQALLCRERPSKAIVFVHGFGGSAGKTWEQFVRCLRGMPEAATADAFFVDYPSTTNTIPFCSSKLREFLVDLLRTPSQRVLNPSLAEGASPRPEAAYEKLVLVGHSMGAVVIRRALLDLDRDLLTPGERAIVRMLFFAPAHKGARSLGGLVAAGLGLDRFAGGSLVGGLLRVWYRSLSDLLRESDCLDDLATHSKERREKRLGEQTGIDYLRATVLHAEKERIVYDDGFDDDHPMKPQMAQTHTSVCKPRDGFRTPADALRELL